MVEPNFKSGKKKPKVPTKTQTMKKADQIFSKIIRSRGRCEGRCNGQPSGVYQCAHGFSRRYRATRWDERNAWCLCAGCHIYWTHRPLEWDEWMKERLGESLYGELRSLALTAPNPDMNVLLPVLQERWAQIERRVA